MKLRILQHEKSFDNIRVGPAFNSDMGITELVQKAKDDYYCMMSISAEDFGKYWTRFAIVDADTLAVIADVYNEQTND